MLAGGNPVRYPLPATADFIPDPDDLARRITGRTKGHPGQISPGNPTGAVFPLDVVQRIGTIAAQSGVYVVSDEIYEDIVFDDARHESFLSHAPPDRVFLVSGASKSYAMTGWRLGWVVCPARRSHRRETAGAGGLVLGHAFAGRRRGSAGKPAGYGRSGTAPVSAPPRHLPRRARPTGMVAGRPRGAFYGLVKLPDRHASALDFARTLLIDEGVAVVPGDTFGVSTSRMVRRLHHRRRAARRGPRRLARALGNGQ